MMHLKKNDTITIYKRIGKRIATFRNNQNLSQAQLAQKLGMKQQVLAGYEIASRRIPISMLYPIADALLVGVEDLIDIDNKLKHSSIPQIQHKMEIIKQFPEYKQKMFLELLDLIIKMSS